MSAVARHLGGTPKPSMEASSKEATAMAYRWAYYGFSSNGMLEKIRQARCVLIIWLDRSNRCAWHTHFGLGHVQGLAFYEQYKTRKSFIPILLRASKPALQVHVGKSCEVVDEQSCFRFCLV